MISGDLVDTYGELARDIHHQSSHDRVSRLLVPRNMKFNDGHG